MNNTFSVQHPDLSGPERILVISDIHGNLDYLKGLLNRLSLRAEDRLVLLGDIVEKGPESLATLRYCMGLRERCHLYPVIGNCDFWHLWVDGLITDPDWDRRTMEHLMHQRSVSRGGIIRDMCAELGLEITPGTDVPALKRTLRERFVPEFDFLRDMPFALETDDYIFVHGGIPAGQTLEEAGAWKCMKIDRFYAGRPHFDKWVVVGHTPVCLYRENTLCAEPIIDPECRLISIDGGCVLKDDGQLNALIIEDGHFSTVSYDCFPLARALGGQAQGERSYYIRWGDNAVTLLSQAEDGFCRIRHDRTGWEMDVPEDFLYHWKDQLCVIDATDYRPAIGPGDVVSIVRETPRGCWIKKNGTTGWYSGPFEYI